MADRRVVVGLKTPLIQNKDQDLKKHVATIHCNNSLSLMQRKIANVLLYNAYKNLRTQDYHTITIPSLCRILGYNSHNYDALKDALRALISTVVEWNLNGDESQNECWTASSVLASVQIEGTECRYAYSHHMRQMLYSPAIYGRISLIIQSRFKSAYGLALYENCSRFKSIGQTSWFELDEFRKLMGVKVGEYDIFRDFNRRVIEKAVEEVNCYSDIIVAPEFRRTNRKVVAIQFKITQREKRGRLGVVDSPKEHKNLVGDEQRTNEINSLVHRLNTEFGVTHHVAKEVVSQYEPEYVDKKIMDVLSSDYYKQGKVKNSASFILAAIKNDYKPLGVAIKNVDKKISKHNIEKEQENARIKSYEIYIFEDFTRHLKDLSESCLNEAINNFFKYFKKTNAMMYKMVKSWYEDDGLESKQFLSFLKDYMTQAKLYVLPSTYEAFISGEEEVVTC